MRTFCTGPPDETEHCTRDKGPKVLLKGVCETIHRMKCMVCVRVGKGEGCGRVHPPPPLTDTVNKPPCDDRDEAVSASLASAAFSVEAGTW